MILARLHTAFRWVFKGINFKKTFWKINRCVKVVNIHENRLFLEISSTQTSILPHWWHCGPPSNLHMQWGPWYLQCFLLLVYSVLNVACFPTNNCLLACNKVQMQPSNNRLLVVLRKCWIENIICNYIAVGLYCSLQPWLQCKLYEWSGVYKVLHCNTCIRFI